MAPLSSPRMLFYPYPPSLSVPAAAINDLKRKIGTPSADVATVIFLRPFSPSFQAANTCISITEQKTPSKKRLGKI